MNTPSSDPCRRPGSPLCVSGALAALSLVLASSCGSGSPTAAADVVPGAPAAVAGQALFPAAGSAAELLEGIAGAEKLAGLVREAERLLESDPRRAADALAAVAAECRRGSKSIRKTLGEASKAARPAEGEIGPQELVRRGAVLFLADDLERASGDLRRALEDEAAQLPVRLEAATYLLAIAGLQKDKRSASALESTVQGLLGAQADARRAQLRRELTQAVPHTPVAFVSGEALGASACRALKNLADAAATGDRDATALLAWYYDLSALGRMEGRANPPVLMDVATTLTELRARIRAYPAEHPVQRLAHWGEFTQILSGDFVWTDATETRKWIELVRLDGHDLADLLEGAARCEGGLGWEADLVGGAALLERAVAKGLPMARTILAGVLEGAQPERAFDLVRAAAAVTRATPSYEPGAHAMLARYLREGVGCDLDEVTAVHALRTGARLGCPSARRELAAPSVDVPLDVTLMLQAARQGDPVAARWLVHGVPIPELRAALGGASPTALFHQLAFLGLPDTIGYAGLQSLNDGGHESVVFNRFLVAHQIGDPYSSGPLGLLLMQGSRGVDGISVGSSILRQLLDPAHRFPKRFNEDMIRDVRDTALRALEGTLLQGSSGAPGADHGRPCSKCAGRGWWVRFESNLPPSQTAGMPAGRTRCDVCWGAGRY